tara:strand:+ start:181 stop:327 length:147 start_codon:yes stop_codon:yes gene_type:complete
MYEVIEHWKQYKLEKLELELKEMLKKNSIKQMDKLLTKLAKKNGVTKY